MHLRIYIQNTKNPLELQISCYDIFDSLIE